VKIYTIRPIKTGCRVRQKAGPNDPAKKFLRECYNLMGVPKSQPEKFEW
jgi:hypothetical protein